jgi:glutathione S-transferase
MSIVLHYFPLYARGETIRTIFHYAGIRFEEKNYEFEEFSMHKAEFEFEELPCLEIDDLKLVQSASISRYLCQKFGYCFKDPYLNYLSSSLVDVREDFVKIKVQIVWFDKNFHGWLDWVKNEFSVVLKSIERRYINNGETGYFVGISPCQADFEMFCLIHDQFLRERVKDTMEPILREHAPKLIEFVESFKNSSESLKKYLVDRPDRMF